jgi:hypothetical protein
MPTQNLIYKYKTLSCSKYYYCFMFGYFDHNTSTFLDECWWWDSRSGFFTPVIKPQVSTGQDAGLVSGSICTRLWRGKSLSGVEIWWSKPSAVNFLTEISQTFYVIVISDDRPDDGGSTHRWNVGLLQRYYTALHPRRLYNLLTVALSLQITLEFPNVVVQRLTRLLFILEILGSNLCLQTACPNWGFSWFSSVLQANAGIMP